MLGAANNGDRVPLLPSLQASSLDEWRIYGACWSSSSQDIHVFQAHVACIKM